MHLDTGHLFQNDLFRQLKIHLDPEWGLGRDLHRVADGLARTTDVIVPVEVEVAQEANLLGK